ncbi:unnamed protein product [Closterium sp. Naga37s-1]|nr:unnamed protein product [Closterium sp. Naga37s-1]
MEFRALVLSCVLLLVSTSALAQRGPPGGGPPGAQGPGGAHAEALALVPAVPADPAKSRRTSPLSLTCPFIFAPSLRNATSNYNLLVEALLVDAAGSPPDSLAIVKGAVCDAAATSILALPLAAPDWQQRAGWWLLRAEARLDAFLENADAATLDALLAVLPTASPPPTSGGGRNGGGNAGGGSAGGTRNGQGGRRMGRELLKRAFGRTDRQGGQKQGGQQQQGGAQKPPAGGFPGGFPGGDGGVNSTVSGYAVLAGSSAAGVTWGGQLMGAKMPVTAV